MFSGGGGEKQSSKQTDKKVLHAKDKTIKGGLLLFPLLYFS